VSLRWGSAVDWLPASEPRDRDSARLNVSRELGPNRSIFRRVICEVAPGAAGARAAVQAALVTAPGGELELVAAVHRDAVSAEEAAPGDVAELEREAEARLAEAVSLVGQIRSVHGTLVRDLPELGLRSAASRRGATLLVVAAGDDGSLASGAGSSLLHAAPCSLMVARAPAESAQFLHSVVVGIDGSTGSTTALRSALELARRYRVEVFAVAATGGVAIDLDSARLSALEEGIELIEDNRPPVAALTSVDADLIVVGNHGLHRLGALGRVSERVANSALCSVLIAR
jgi:nucleotide-binding universal stress UspA family protein